MARHITPSRSFHRLLDSRHYPPNSPAPPPCPLLLPKNLSPAVSAPASSSLKTNVAAGAWGKVSAVLFDMDGVLCNSEEPSRRAAVDVFAEMGVDVAVDDFVPFMGTVQKNAGLKAAVASSADRIWVDADLAAGGFPVSLSLDDSLANE